MALLRAAIDRFPALRKLRDRLLPSPAAANVSEPVSTNYVEMSPGEADGEAARLRGAWKAGELPERQRRLADQQLRDYRRGAPVDVYDALVRALRNLKDATDGASVLEIGCSSGYYAEVFDIAGLPLKYTGCDYSEPFIALAKERYPDLSFDVEDATALHYPDNAFDIVVSGGCLLHIPEYEAAIAETARVAKRYAVFHRTPVVFAPSNKYFRKLAYGVETVEIHFNEPRFLALLEKHGLTLIDSITISEERVSPDTPPVSATRTHVLRKQNA
jgi:ubiquinone/menaquinone biosynthesis C-methylase UbiE